jgi:hypothetical protein
MVSFFGMMISAMHGMGINAFRVNTQNLQSGAAHATRHIAVQPRW